MEKEHRLEEWFAKLEYIPKFKLSAQRKKIFTEHSFSQVGLKTINE